MKIGFDGRSLMNKNYSGVSFYAWQLLRALLALDQTNQYLVFYNSLKKVALPAFGQANADYRGFHFPNKLFNLSLLLFNQPKLDQLLGGVDIFFSPNLHFLSWSKPCRKVMVVHDLSFLAFPGWFDLKRRWWHYLILRKKFLEQADLLIADSFSTKDDLVDFLKIKPEKIVVAYPGVDERFQVIASQEELKRVKNKYNLPEKFILFLSTLEPRKNLAGVMAAFKLLKGDYQLLIVGGRGWKDKKILDLAQNQPRIKFLGYLAEADKPALYNLADLLIYPSFYEGFGLPPLEAMACGTPAILGNNSSQKEAVAGAGLLVDPFNLTEIKEAMTAALFDQNLRKELIERGLERVKRFTWQNTAKAVLEALNSF